MNGAQFWRNVDKILAAKGQRRPWLAKEMVKAEENNPAFEAIKKTSLGRINNWYTRKILPRVDEAEIIARALETTTVALMGTNHAEAVPRMDEGARDMMEFYQKLSYPDKAAFAVVAKALCLLLKTGVINLQWKDLAQVLRRLQQEGDGKIPS